MPALTFFIGKGGVGKTTLSSAYAVREAMRLHGTASRKKGPAGRTLNRAGNVLVLSTDPAHSLADIFQVKLGDSPQRIGLPGSRKRSGPAARGAGGELFAWQINAEKQFHEFLRPYRDQVLGLIESGTIFSRKEIEPLLNTTLPGMAEVAALLAIHKLLHPENGGGESRPDGGKSGIMFDHIVVDTAPIGHTLRLFELPEHFSHFLDFLDLAGSRDRWLAQRFGGHGGLSSAFLEHWQQVVEQIKDGLSAEQSRLYMVTSAEEFSLNEALRSSEQLKISAPRLRIDAIALNRVVLGGSVHRGKRSDTPCERCAARREQAKSAQAFLKQNFPQVPVLAGEDPGFPIVGVEALAEFGAGVFSAESGSQTRASAVAEKKLGAALRRQSFKGAKAKEPKLERAMWPGLATPLAFTVGKGGVGKTTVSAALGFHHRATHPSRTVTVCSTDPAPSLDDVFQADVTGTAKSVLGDKRLRAMEIDSVGEYRAWSEEMQSKIERALSSDSEGIHVDLSFDRQIFTALLNIVPPGVDEIFAIFKILELTAEKDSTAIIDMAPTGHALELLRMPERMLLWSRLLLKSLAAHRTLPIAQDVAVEIASIGQQVRQLVAVLQEASRSRIMVVMLPEPLPDAETARLLSSIEALPASVEAIFVNRLLRKEHTAGCSRCERARLEQNVTLAKIKKRYAGRTIYLIENFPEEVAGKTALRNFTKNLWQLA